MATVITNLLSAIPYLGQDLVVSTYGVLPILGILSPHAIKNPEKYKEFESYWKEIPFSFLSLLAGFIDGDGYFSIQKTPKGFITIRLVISLHLNDELTLRYFQSILKLGQIYIYPNKKNCVWVIHRTELQKCLIPLLIYHQIFFLTETRRKQFDLVLFLIKNNIRNFNEIPNSIPCEFNLPFTKEDYIRLPFFRNWIVGFTLAEGSFFFKKNKDGCFQLSQRKHSLLFESFNLIFSSSRKIGLSKNQYNLFSLYSKKDIQKVIEFFSFSGHHPLIGLKFIQYQNWLIQLKQSSRYKDLKFPIE